METSYKYQKIDAFTAGSSLGNPAACIYLSPEQSLNETQMLEIAKQHKGFVSEVIYCKNDNNGVYLTFYSSECEVDFCGHGTIACMYSLVKNTPKLLKQKEIAIQTNKKGVLTVYNKIAEQDTVLISAPEPIYIGTKLSAKEIAKNLGVKESEIDTDFPIDLIDAGLRTLIVPIANLQTEIPVFPKEEQLKEFCLQNSIDIILIYCKEAENQKNIAHTRVFAPKFGYLEDPATGSGNSAFGYYMLKNNLWDGKDCSVEQGGNNRVFNSVYLSNLNGTVLFGGSATLRIDGVYYL